MGNWGVGKPEGVPRWFHLSKKEESSGIQTNLSIEKYSLDDHVSLCFRFFDCCLLSRCVFPLPSRTDKIRPASMDTQKQEEGPYPCRWSPSGFPVFNIVRVVPLSAPCCLIDCIPSRQRAYRLTMTQWRTIPTSPALSKRIKGDAWPYDIPEFLRGFIRPAGWALPPNHELDFRSVR
jgi:hypothetical protein